MVALVILLFLPVNTFIESMNKDYSFEKNYNMK
jgi:hypothetical protein